MNASTVFGPLLSGKRPFLAAVYLVVAVGVFLGPAEFAPAQDEKKKGVAAIDLAASVLSLEREDAYFGPLAFSPDGRLLACSEEPVEDDALNPGRRLSAVRVYDTARRKQVARLPAKEIGERPQAAAFSPDGKKLAVVCPHFSIRVWDLAAAKPLFELKRDVIIESPWSHHTPLIFTPDSKLLISLTTSRTAGDGLLELHVWDAGTGKVVRSIGEEFRSPPSFWLSEDGKTVLSEHSRLEGHDQLNRPKVERIGAVLWDVKSGGCLGAVGRPTQVAFNIVNEKPTPKFKFRAGQQLLASGAGGPGFRVRISPAGRIILFPRSPTGALLAASSIHLGKGFRVSDASTGEELHQFKEYARVSPPFTFSPGGKYLTLPEVRGRLSAENRFILLDISPWQEKAQRNLPLQEADVAAQWDALADPDGKRAYWAMRRLAATPEFSLPLLKKHLRPVPVRAKNANVKPGDLDALERQELRDLFLRTGEQTMAMLNGLVDPDLLRDVAAALARQHLAEPDPDARRLLWGLDVLEEMGTPAARELLEQLAGGAPGAWLTLEARASLGRLKNAPKDNK